MAATYIKVLQDPQQGSQHNLLPWPVVIALRQRLLKLLQPSALLLRQLCTTLHAMLLSPMQAQQDQQVQCLPLLVHKHKGKRQLEAMQ